MVYYSNSWINFLVNFCSFFFYNFAYWRKRLGIKANIEMFFLPDEMYKQRGKVLTFTFGAPISWKIFTDEHPPEYWSERVKRHVYALPKNALEEMLPTIVNQNI